MKCKTTLKGILCWVVLLVAALGLSSAELNAAIQIQSLTPHLPSPQPVGTTIAWLATATDTNAGTLDYRFSVKTASMANYAVVRDFHRTRFFEWTPSKRDGGYLIQVIVRNTSTFELAQKTELFLVTSRVTGGVPVVNPTRHPLVALYSAPPCPAGSTMHVLFVRVGGNVPDTTPEKPCDGTFSMNFYLAGMLAGQQYIIRHEILTGATSTPGPFLSFTAGTIPPSLVFPPVSVPVPPNLQTSLADNVVLHDCLSQAAQILFPAARDLFGNIIWYYDRVGGTVQEARFFIRPIQGGTFLIHLNDITNPDPLFRQNQVLREFDLAGNTLRETNARRVSEQLTKMGYPTIDSFHHDAIRLPNGHTLTLASTEQIFPAGTQGSVDPVDILGDMVVDLDENWQVAWAWNSYDRMDINRPAVLGETCAPLQPGCPPFRLAPSANDWLHSNSLHYVPADGSVLISMRHMDWVVKIDYANGSGSGNVIWRLGKDGDFSVISADPYPWFSHQHDAGYELGGTQFLSIYDNGNTRVAQLGPGNSRGQVYVIDEPNLTATLALNADLGGYSFALGSAQRLTNGNYHFESGILNPAGLGQGIEVLPAGTINYVLESQAVTYRSYRMVDLYTPPQK